MACLTTRWVRVECGRIVGVTPAQRARQVVNVINLSTPLGLIIAKLAGARLTKGPDGLLLGYGYRLGVPRNSAFTVGNVVLLRGDEKVLQRRPTLLAHEARHASQYAICVGPVSTITPPGMTSRRIRAGRRLVLGAHRRPRFAQRLRTPRGSRGRRLPGTAAAPGVPAPHRLGAFLIRDRRRRATRAAAPGCAGG